MIDFSYLPGFLCQFIGKAIHYKNNRPKITLPLDLLDDKFMVEGKKYIVVVVELDEDKTN